jgi:hypothetical protein
LDRVGRKTDRRDRPCDERGVEKRPEAVDDRPPGDLDDAPQPGPPDRHQRVAEVECHGLNRRGAERGHVATLDGQISRYGQ